MRSALVYRNNTLVGMLTQYSPTSYTFVYNAQWLANPQTPPLCLAMPKTAEPYTSDVLFPVFFNMLSEGVNKKLQTTFLKIDENDHFALLLATAHADTVGAITLQPMPANA